MPRPGSPGSVGAHVQHIGAAGGPGRPPTVTPFERFLLWERSSRDTIEVKRTYIDIAGDLVAGILLSQIVYWHLPDRDGKSRLRVQREGKFWIAKSRTEWWDECRVSPKQVDRALEALRRRNVIETRLFKFNGSPTVHVRLDEVGFMAQWEDHLEHPEGGNGAGTVPDFHLRGKSNSPTRVNPSSGPGQTHLDGQVRTSTENTAEITAQTTTGAGAALGGAADNDGVVVALLGSLTQAGVTRKRAAALLVDHTADAIRSQLAMLGYRKADDPAAVLVRAIEEDWAPPAEFRKAVAEREKEERQRLRREQRAREQAEQTAAEDARKAAEDEWWDALGVEEQEELRAEAEASLRKKNPFLFGNGGPKKTGVMYQTMFDAQRRALVSQRMYEARHIASTESVALP